MCCFYAQQYDMTLSCMERALDGSTDDGLMGDVWYNLSHLGLQLGDTNLAYQALRIAVSIDPYNGEAFNNLGILEMKKGNTEAAKSSYLSAITVSPHLHDPCYNLGAVPVASPSFVLIKCYRGFVLPYRKFPGKLQDGEQGVGHVTRPHCI
jgi:tetratricopeptide repeat protein 8